MNNVDTSGDAVVQIDGFIGSLITSEGDRGDAPTIKTYDRVRFLRTFDLIKQCGIDSHVAGAICRPIDD
jgi:hypothetical protein